MCTGKDNSPPLIDKCNIMRVFVSKQNGADGGKSRSIFAAIDGFFKLTEMSAGTNKELICGKFFRIII